MHYTDKQQLLGQLATVGQLIEEAYFPLQKVTFQTPLVGRIELILSGFAAEISGLAQQLSEEIAEDRSREDVRRRVEQMFKPDDHRRKPQPPIPEYLLNGGEQIDNQDQSDQEGPEGTQGI